MTVEELMLLADAYADSQARAYWQQQEGWVDKYQQEAQDRAAEARRELFTELIKVVGV